MSQKTTFERTRIEVARSRNGRPGYVWVEGLYVIADGVKFYPPMRIREAREFARKLETQISP